MQGILATTLFGTKLGQNELQAGSGLTVEILVSMRQLLLRLLPAHQRVNIYDGKEEIEDVGISSARVTLSSSNEGQEDAMQSDRGSELHISEL